jgi:TPR repeat protein
MKKIILPLISSVLFASTLDTAVLELTSNNYNKAIKLLKSQKETKQIDFLLGKAYYKRHLTYTDYSLAMKYFKKANTKQSLYYIGKLYQEGLGVNKNIQAAIRYYNLSNTKEAQYELGKLYLEGKYVIKNKKLALKLLKESAKKGCTKAQLTLGKLYLTDNDFVEKDFRKAAKWLYLSAHNGDLEAKKLWNQYKLYRYQ